jgi:hypothetical protein
LASRRKLARNALEWCEFASAREINEPCQRRRSDRAHVDPACDVDVAGRRLLTMIDGLGAQKVVRAVPTDEAKHIAQAYFASELKVAGSTA